MIYNCLFRIIYSKQACAVANCKDNFSENEVEILVNILFFSSYVEVPSDEGRNKSAKDGGRMYVWTCVCGKICSLLNGEIYMNRLLVKKNKYYIKHFFQHSENQQRVNKMGKMDPRLYTYVPQTIYLCVRVCIELHLR